MARINDERDGRWMVRWLGPLAPSGLVGQTVTIVAMLTILSAGAYLIWSQMRSEVISQPDYLLQADRIHVTPPPPWVRCDVKLEAITAGNLTELNIRQEDLTPRIAQAFAMHSWVAKVHQCYKEFPAKVTVELEYRQPVAMVKVAQGWLPIDREGFLLPPTDFTQEEAQQYPRIFAKGASQLGPVGTAWGDPRIHGAAAVVDKLVQHWKTLGLFAVVAEYPSRASTAKPGFELRTTADTRIVWGNAPGEEAIGEANHQLKIARLREFHDKHGTLDTVGPHRVIDLRRSDRLYIARADES